LSKKVHIRDGKAENKVQHADAEADEKTKTDADETAANDVSAGPASGNGEEDPVEVLAGQLEAALKEKEAIQDKYLRAAAEFDNYKKRLERQWEDFKKYAHESVIRELLTVADNLERAIAAAKEEPAPNECLVSGVDMTLKEIWRVFDKFGVTPIIAMGRTFDPNFHEAVARRESEDADANIIIEEYQKGYMIHDRLLRPSMVVVSAGKKKSDVTDG